MRVAVVLFNLGGPDRLEAVEPFLSNLFADPAILPLPWPFRTLVARLIAKRRAPLARKIYKQIGGRSPLLEETEVQARALEAALMVAGVEARAFIAMRAWHPLARATVRDVLAYGPDRVVLLPLYPQFSTTTSDSSLTDWYSEAARAGLTVRTHRVCCYPWGSGFVAAVAQTIGDCRAERRPDVAYRVLFSAHGLPEYVVQRGDPYPWQVARSVEAVVDVLGRADLDWRISYQSRVGPMKWLGPSTEAEIRRAGDERRGLIVVPIAFVSEHSETLVELDLEYGKLARDCGVPHYLRARSVGARAPFIDGLAALVRRALEDERPVTCGSGRICPAGIRRCGYGEAA